MQTSLLTQRDPAGNERLALQGTTDRRRMPTAQAPRRDASQHNRTPLASTAYLGDTDQLDVYGNMCVLQRRYCRRRPPNRRPKKRGTVRRYSPASRRRLLRTLMSIDDRHLTAPTMVTLTFHRPLCDRSAWTALRTWIRAIRHRYPSVAYLWRMELQRRGAIHFHVVLWLPSHLFRIPRHHAWRGWLCRTWHRIADPESQPHTRHGAHATVVTGGTAARRYLTKYVAKDGDSEAAPEGRRWGASRNLPRRPIISVELTHPEFIQLRRIIRRLLQRRAKDRRRMRGYVLGASTVHAYIAYDTVLRLLLEYAPDSYARALARATDPL